jgi:cytoskeletal protein RodZ
MSENTEVGEILKRAREKKHVSLKEASEKTRISVSILELLEEGEYKKLPSYIHAVGFLKLYVNFLGLEFDTLKDTFEREYKGVFYEEVQAKEALHEIIADVKKIDKQKQYIYVTVVILCILIIIISLLVFLKMNNSIVKKNNTNEVNNMTKNVVLGNENVSSMKPEDMIDNENESDNYTLFSPVDLVKQLKESERTEKTELKSVTFEFSDTCWIHINIDGKHELDFIAEAGSNKIVEFFNFFEIDVGNASAIKIKYKDQTFTGLGGWRQPVKKLYFNIDKDGNLVFLKK